MIKKKIEMIRNCFENLMRSFLGRMTPDGRIILLISVFVAFCGISIYTTYSTVYSFGKKSGRKQMEIEHLNRLELEKTKTLDSINSLKQLNHDSPNY